MLFISVVVASLVSCAALAASSLPADARDYLNSLPEKSLTLELVLARALEKSDSFRAVAAQKYRVVNPEREARAAFDTQLTINSTWMDDRNEPGIPFSPNSKKVNSTSLGVAKRFSTGTAVSVDLSESRNELKFPNNTPLMAPYYETKAVVGISQNLLADSFGYASRRALEAGRLQARAHQAQFESQVEDWALTMADVYYGAWLAQAHVAAARSGLRRREQLLSSTRLKLRRGTAEEPDFLQVDAAYRLSKIEQEKAETLLADQWRGLVLTLKLPAEWVMIDAFDIPMKLDDVQVRAEKACARFRQQGVPAEAPPALQQAERMKEAAQLMFERARSEAWPDLKLVGQFGFNGVEEDGGRSWRETGERDHPQWLVGLAFTYELEQNLRKLKMGEAAALRIQSEAAYRQEADLHRARWMNECANLARLRTAREESERAFKNQMRRVELEERRFRLGRSSVFNLIQAGDDATATEIAWRSTEVEYRQSAWRVLRLNASLRGELDTILKKHGHRGLDL